MNKKSLINNIQLQLNREIEELKVALKTIDEELESETKSSAGDKFETSREMMTQERQKLGGQIAYKEKLIHSFDTLNQEQEHSPKTVGFGTLIDLGDFMSLFGIPAGKFSIQGQAIYCISANSPLGQLLQAKKVGDTIPFNSKSLTVQAIQ